MGGLMKRKRQTRHPLNVPERHQLKIAKDTLRMSDEGAMIMGGMTKEEAREFLRVHGWLPADINKLEGIILCPICLEPYLDAEEEEAKKGKRPCVCCKEDMIDRDTKRAYEKSQELEYLTCPEDY
jgi:hypothetical protein